MTACADLDLPGLLARLDAAGVRLSLYLDADGPDDVLTDELMAELRAHKPLLLYRLAREALRAELSAWRWGPADSEPEPGLVVHSPPGSGDLAAPRQDEPTALGVPAGPDARAATGGSPEAPTPSRSRCENPYCLQKGRWWRSVYGVVSCLNCRPPAVPELVAEIGEEPVP